MSVLNYFFSSNYETGNPTQEPGVLYGIYTALLIIALLAAIYVYVRRRPLSNGFAPRRHMLRIISQAVMYISVIALFFCVMRYTEILYLDIPLFSFLMILSVIAYIGWLTYYFSEKYPVAMYQAKQTEADKRYRPNRTRKPVAVPVASTGKSPIARGKRKR